MSESSPSKPSRDADKFIVRLPDGMRTRIAEVAKANNRTMNAEVVARLVASFEQTDGPLPPGEHLYVLIDSSGYPISWAEIMEYTSALREAGGFDPASMQTTVVTPELESSSKRRGQAVLLARRLREGGGSRAIDSEVRKGAHDGVGEADAVPEGSHLKRNPLR